MSVRLQFLSYHLHSSFALTFMQSLADGECLATGVVKPSIRRAFPNWETPRPVNRNDL